MVDMIMCEIMFGLDQVEGVLKGVMQGDKLVWICCLVDDEDGIKFCNGDFIDGIFKFVEKYEFVVVLINCLIFEVVSQVLFLILNKGILIGVYVNGFIKIIKEFVLG